MNRKIIEKQETEQTRGWILYLLYLSKPKPVELNKLWGMLDQYNQPVLRRKFVEEIDYLRSRGLIGVFNSGSKTELTDDEQSRLIQRYVEASTAREMGTFLFARPTVAGIDFQEGNSEVPGVQRVE